MRKLFLLALLSLGIATASPMMNTGAPTTLNLGTKIPCSYSEARLGHVELYRNNDGFRILHDGNIHDIHPGFVDKLVRNMDQDQLIQFLGLDRPQITPITAEQFEEQYGDAGFQVHEISESEKEEILSLFSSGYLRLEQMSDGEFTLKAFNRGLGGGPITGTIVGIGVKAIGYTTIAVCGGPVGWAMVGWSLGETIASGLIGGALNFLAGGGKLAKATKKAKEAAKAADKARKMLQGVQKVAEKAPTAKNLKHVAKLVNKFEKLNSISIQKTAKLVAMGGGKGVVEGAMIVDVAENGVTTAKNIKNAQKAAKAGKAVFMPTAAMVDGVADVCQLICDFLPTP